MADVLVPLINGSKKSEIPVDTCKIRITSDLMVIEKDKQCHLKSWKEGKKKVSVSWMDILSYFAVVRDIFMWVIVLYMILEVFKRMGKIRQVKYHDNCENVFVLKAIEHIEKKLDACCEKNLHEDINGEHQKIVPFATDLADEVENTYTKYEAQTRGDHMKEQGNADYYKYETGTEMQGRMSRFNSRIIDSLVRTELEKDIVSYADNDDVEKESFDHRRIYSYMKDNFISSKRENHVSYGENPVTNDDADYISNF